MQSYDSKARLRRVVGWTSCFLALASVTALGATLVVLASSNFVPSSKQTLLIVSVVFDMLALLVFAGVAALLMKHVHGRSRLQAVRRLVVIAAFAILSLLAIILTLVALVETRASIGRSVPIAQRNELNTLSGTSLSLCVLFLIFQIAFFMATFTAPAAVEEIATTTDTAGSFSSELKDSPQTNKSRDMFTPVEPAPMSPLTSTFSITPPRRASIRDSFTNFLQPVIQPMTSKSRLIRQNSVVSSASQHSRDDSWGNRAEEAFDNWEVSPIEEQIETTPPPAAFPGTRLDPIPASRPASPAKPLDGPFPAYEVSQVEEPMLPFASLPNHSQPSVEDTTVSVPFAMHDNASVRSIPYTITRKNSLPPHGAIGAVTRDGRKITPPGSHSRAASIEPRPSSSRSARPSTDEQHIHPLFRTESSLPPPVTSPGTIVTASPWGGQVVPMPDPTFFSPSTAASRQGSFSVPRPRSPIRPPSRGSPMVRSGSAQGFSLRPTGQVVGRMRSSSSAGHGARPPLRSVRSEEAWGRARVGAVDASMPPRVYPGIMVRKHSVY
ncbi:hypothetical protein BDZ85DRAFT_268753 [Elsinoe ampelina]|uniref:Uncharacterized protein n=1 Tax=Elsinoe ampelina TaxID=302913 RepID=A0A6A6G0P7_9PEZI|nr:hypothetical protein BDZ85DRAFT_268753 [Elsinoe ampelina]